MAAVYTLGVLNGTEVHHNLLHDVYAWYTGGYCLSQDQGQRGLINNHSACSPHDMCLQAPQTSSFTTMCVMRRQVRPRPSTMECTTGSADVACDPSLSFYLCAQSTSLSAADTSTTSSPAPITQAGLTRTRLASAVYDSILVIHLYHPHLCRCRHQGSHTPSRLSATLCMLTTSQTLPVRSSRGITSMTTSSGSPLHPTCTGMLSTQTLRQPSRLGATIR